MDNIQRISERINPGLTVKAVSTCNDFLRVNCIRPCVIRYTDGTELVIYTDGISYYRIDRIGQK